MLDNQSQTPKRRASKDAKKHEPQSLSRSMCVLAVYNKAQAQRISNHEFNLWAFPRVATFHAGTFIFICKLNFLKDAVSVNVFLKIRKNLEIKTSQMANRTILLTYKYDTYKLIYWI